MRHSTLHYLVPLVGAVTLMAAPVGAQDRAERGRQQPVLEDSSVLAIFAADGPHARGWRVTPLLRQAQRAQPQARLDSIADELTAIAIATTSVDRALDALSELKASAVPTSDMAPGKVYAGAMARLLRVHAESREGRVRAAAIHGLLGIGERKVALAYLREVVLSADETARWALLELTLDAGTTNATDSKALIRQIFEADQVRDRAAREDLRSYATAQGWLVATPGKGVVLPAAQRPPETGGLRQ